MTIILTHSDLNRSLADIKADKSPILQNVKQGLRDTIKLAVTVWFLDQGRLTCLKSRNSTDVKPILLGANQTAPINDVVDP